MPDTNGMFVNDFLVLPGQWRPQNRWEHIAWVCPPWPSQYYIWLDLPEAIFCKTGNLYLSHINEGFPALFPDLPKIEWKSTDDGLHFKRILPNGVEFSVRYKTHERTMVSVELNITNNSDTLLEDMHLQTCAYMRAIKEFSDLTAENKFIFKNSTGWETLPPKYKKNDFRKGDIDFPVVATRSAEAERYIEYDNHLKKDVEKVKTEPQIIDDAVRGRVVRAEEKDFVIFRGNGQPVFHFVNVVDDIAMGITHVIRGEDHLSNTSKHMELYQALGAKIPVFAHIPLILKASGPGKMSKRDRGALVEEYKDQGLLPDAVRNFLCLLGWNPKDDQEIMPIQEIIELFDFPGINKDNARFDERKLSFINTEYLRKLPIEAFTSKALPVLEFAGLVDKTTDPGYTASVLKVAQEKVRSLPELPGYVNYFFKEDYSENAKAKKKVFNKENALLRLEEFKDALVTMSEVDFTEEILESKVQSLSEKNDCYTGEYIHPTRFALSGTNAGPSFYLILVLLGKEKCLNRIRRFLEKEK